MTSKMSPRLKKNRKDDVKHEIVVQVHKPALRDGSSDRETLKNTEPSEESSESNKTYFLEDKNENYSVHTPSRDISVDGDVQINTKIISLIENEMKRDINKHSHFTDSRPQSLSFYEDEKIPEELSGNLELLSPEERKHYKRRKDHGQMDTEERNMYNTIQDIYNRENEDMNCLPKKSKSRKKRHQDPDVGLGDSREIILPKEKKKSKKKRRENSPASSTMNKKKHRRKEEDFEPKNDITLALEELQDDVFENGVEELCNGNRHEKVRRSPRKSDRLYVQKKNRFELVNRESECLNKGEGGQKKGRFTFTTSIELAKAYQKIYNAFSTFCHGILGGMAFAHIIFVNRNTWDTQEEFLNHISMYNHIYTCSFSLLTVPCIVSVFDRYDIARLTATQAIKLFKTNKRSIVIMFYLSCMLCHLIVTPLDDKISLYSYNETSTNITINDIKTWSIISTFRSIFAILSWIIIGTAPYQDWFYVHLENIQRYLPGSWSET